MNFFFLKKKKTNKNNCSKNNFLSHLFAWISFLQLPICVQTNMEYYDSWFLRLVDNCEYK